MTLKEYAKLINNMAKKHPNLQVCYASDDEGNDFKAVVYEPSLGEFHARNGYFEFNQNNKHFNAICIN